MSSDLDHPADIQVHAWGDSLEDTFASAALAMLTYMCGGDDLRGEDVPSETALHVRSTDLEALLHDFLSKVLVSFVSGAVLCRFTSMEVREDAEGWQVGCTAGVVQYNQARHGQGSEVKAVTFSNLRVGRRSPFDAYVVLDI